MKHLVPFLMLAAALTVGPRNAKADCPPWTIMFPTGTFDCYPDPDTKNPTGYTCEPVVVCIYVPILSGGFSPVVWASVPPNAPQPVPVWYDPRNASIPAAVKPAAPVGR